MKVYISFGSNHNYLVPRAQTEEGTQETALVRLDHRSLACIEVPTEAEGRAVAFHYFGSQWSMCYTGEIDTTYFPRGIMPIAVPYYDFINEQASKLYILTGESKQDEYARIPEEEIIYAALEVGKYSLDDDLSWFSWGGLPKQGKEVYLRRKKADPPSGG